ncbi:hypothetical protein DFJ73DRAFT_808360 [Zopfochytrium polystomum]|nr:hypothetical protein DFJ73DRAFT_808360 [Zopfochytrium polystomum]
MATLLDMSASPKACQVPLRDAAAAATAATAPPAVPAAAAATVPFASPQVPSGVVIAARDVVGAVPSYADTHSLHPKDLWRRESDTSAGLDTRAPGLNDTTWTPPSPAVSPNAATAGATAPLTDADAEFSTLPIDEPASTRPMPLERLAPAPLTLVRECHSLQSEPASDDYLTFRSGRTTMIRWEASSLEEANSGRLPDELSPSATVDSTLILVSDPWTAFNEKKSAESDFDEDIDLGSLATEETWNTPRCVSRSPSATPILSVRSPSVSPFLERPLFTDDLGSLSADLERHPVEFQTEEHDSGILSSIKPTCPNPWSFSLAAIFGQDAPFLSLVDTAETSEIFHSEIMERFEDDSEKRHSEMMMERLDDEALDQPAVTDESPDSNLEATFSSESLEPYLTKLEPFEENCPALETCTGTPAKSDSEPFVDHEDACQQWDPDDILKLPINPSTQLYDCPYRGCYSSHARRYNLKIHYLIHLGEASQVFTCNECNRGFRRRFDMRRHRLAKHGVPLDESVAEDSSDAEFAAPKHRRSENSKTRSKRSGTTKAKHGKIAKKVMSKGVKSKRKAPARRSRQ